MISCEGSQRLSALLGLYLSFAEATCRNVSTTIYYGSGSIPTRSGASELFSNSIRLQGLHFKNRGHEGSPKHCSDTVGVLATSMPEEQVVQRHFLQSSWECGGCDLACCMLCVAVSDAPLYCIHILCTTNQLSNSGGTVEIRMLGCCGT